MVSANKTQNFKNHFIYAYMNVFLYKIFPGFLEMQKLFVFVKVVYDKVSQLFITTNKLFDFKIS
jgi:hypothetical protein